MKERKEQGPMAQGETARNGSKWSAHFFLSYPLPGEIFVVVFYVNIFLWY